MRPHIPGTHLVGLEVVLISAICSLPSMSWRSSPTSSTDVVSMAAAAVR
jgi:hypothetical protein